MPHLSAGWHAEVFGGHRAAGRSLSSVSAAAGAERFKPSAKEGRAAELEMPQLPAGWHSEVFGGHRAAGRCLSSVSAAAGAERFKPSVNEGRVSELEFLQQYLKDALAKLDSQIEGKVAPLERMKRLLTAPDKKATLLEMAGERPGSSCASSSLQAWQRIG